MDTSLWRSVGFVCYRACSGGSDGYLVLCIVYLGVLIRNGTKLLGLKYWGIFASAMLYNLYFAGIPGGMEWFHSPRVRLPLARGERVIGVFVTQQSKKLRTIGPAHDA
jgi:hypothetical protein